MRQKKRVALISWNSQLAEEHRKLLEEAEFVVEPLIARGSGMIGKMAAAAPVAIVIDLDSKPAYGREAAIVLRNSKTTRRFPLIFAGGAAEKIPAIRAEIPDAVYCAWDEIRAGVKRGIAHAPVQPVRPRGRGEGAVMGPVLAKKMRIHAGMRVTIVGDVIGLGRRLGMEYEEQVHPHTELALTVVRTAREMEDAFEMLAAQLPSKAVIWILYPKQSGGLKSDFTLMDVLARGQAFGFSGFMTCAVDTEWSGARLVRKDRR
jgi:hypothetical protein